MRSKLIYISTCSFLCFTGLSYSGENAPSASVYSADLLLRNVNLNDHDELLDILVKYGNNPDGIPALLYAAKMGDMHAVELLIKHGADPFTVDHAGNTAVYFSLFSANYELLQFFLDKGLNPNLEAPYDHGAIGFTPIAKLYDEKYLKCVDLLIDRGLKLNSDCVGRIPSLICIGQGNLPLLKLILSKGAGIPTDPINGVGLSVYIFYDCLENRKGKMECLKWLIQNKKLNPKNLDISSIQNPDNANLIANTFPEMLQFLVENSHLKVNQKLNGREDYPLHCCVSKPALVRVLIQNGANINAKGCYGDTALHLVASTTAFVSDEPLDAIKILVANGADINARDDRSRTPLKSAADPRVRKLLISLGAVE